MITHHVDDLKNTGRHVVTDRFESTRLVVKSDNVGYSLHHTIVPEGKEVHCHYKQHFEANYCIAGEGEVYVIATGKTYPVCVGTMYLLDLHDEHILRSTNGPLHLVCVFNPPLSGAEVHDEDGSYSLD